jgi:fatty acid desaturase
VYSGNTVYDITPWLDRHPGGKDMLLLCAGRDVTDAIPSYHPFSNKPSEVLDKFAVGRIEETEFPQFKPDTGLYRTMSARVAAYFKRTGKDPKSPWPGLARLAVFFAGAAVTFSLMHRLDLSWGVRLLAAVFYGVFQALPLLHSMHDASHTSIGHSEWWWRIIGRLTLDLFAGANLTSWYNQHVVGHHLYTNVFQVDPDLPMTKEGDIRRVAPQQVWVARYGLQQYYLAFLYGFLAMKFRVQDIVGLLTRSNGAIRVNINGSWEYIRQAATKIAWVAWRFVFPIVVMGVPTRHVLALFVVSDMVTGYYLAFNFQVSHISPSADFPGIDSPFADEWAVSQVRTSVDYGHGNWLMTELAGALNYQVEHHLFPSVSQYHYPAIAPIVMETCREFNVPYTLLPDFTTALGMHFAHLRTLGAGGEKAHHH